MKIQYVGNSDELVDGSIGDIKEVMANPLCFLQLATCHVGALIVL
jgi:hypothetical protein